MAKAISTQNTRLYYGASLSALTELANIKDYPDLIGDPNLIDVTDLKDTQQSNITGVKSSDIMQFTCNYTKDSFKAVNQKADADGFYALVFGDGSGFTWPGRHTLGVPGEGVDDPVEFTINITNTGDLTFQEEVSVSAGA